MHEVNLDLLPEVSGNNTTERQETRQLRLLVAVASFGEKNIRFLEKIIHRYRSMSMQTDVVVLSEAPKKLDAGAKVNVGLPCKDPWSLPFGHKKLFADNADRYDLFAYSEDDMEVTEENIRAFLRLTPQLEPDEIAGFLRFEANERNDLSLPEVHGAYHWRPESVRRRGPYTVAEFSNEHAAFYLLTQTQLKTAIASGGYLREPYQGRYDMLCSAATDPYTSCGFRKVVCISPIDDFLIHHLPNRYAGRLGLPLSSFREQIATLMDIRNGIHPATTLCEVEPKVLQQNWSKSFYERPCDDLFKLLPDKAANVLSVGCGWGASEVRLMERGISVTALPLDSVIGAAAARRGIEVVYGSLEEGIRRVEGRDFDGLLISNLLPLLQDPCSLLEKCARLLRPRAPLVISSPNFDYLPILTRRFMASGEYRKLKAFSTAGIHALSIDVVHEWLRRAGLILTDLVWQTPKTGDMLSGAVSAPRGLGLCLNLAWQSLRRAGLGLESKFSTSLISRSRKLPVVSCQPSRFIATNWIARAIRKM